MFDWIDQSVIEYTLSFVICWFLLRWIVYRNDPEIQELKERLAVLEDTQLEMEQIDGTYYLWAVFPDEGHKFIGQSHSKEELAKRGTEYLHKKFMPS